MPEDSTNGLPDLSPIFYGPATTAFTSSHQGRFKLVWKNNAKLMLNRETNELSGKVTKALQTAKFELPDLTKSVPDAPSVPSLNLRPPSNFECASLDTPSIPPVTANVAWLDEPDLLSLEAPDASFLSLMMSGSLVDLSETFGGFLLDAGLGCIPVVHTFRALFQSVKAGVNLGLDAYELHQMHELAQRVKISNAYGGPSHDPKNAAFCTWFRDGLTEMNKTNTANSALRLGSYVLDTGLSLVDPTPVSGLVMSASRIAAKVYTLYRQWTAVTQVNSILANSSKWDPVIFAKCPILFCYLFRLQYRDAGQPAGVGTRGRRGAISGTPQNQSELVQYSKQQLVPWERINSIQAQDCANVLSKVHEHIKDCPFELHWVSTAPLGQQHSLAPQPLCIDPTARQHDLP